MINDGLKNRRIEIWKLSGVEDAANEPVVDPWVLHLKRWAQIKMETGMGAIRAAGAAGGVNTPLSRVSFRINYTRNIDNTMQVRDSDGVRYNIIGIQHDLADRDWTDVIGETGGANG